MRIILSILCIGILAGCSTIRPGSDAPSTVSGFWNKVTQTDTGSQAGSPVHPIDHTTARMTGLGGLLIMLGILVGVFTKFASGWGINLAGSGFLMVILAWAFQQWWVPWISIATIFAYVCWRLYIHEPPAKFCLNPKPSESK